MVEPDIKVFTIEANILRVDDLEEDNLIKAVNFVEAFKVGGFKEDIIMKDILMEAFKVDSLIEADSLKEAFVEDKHNIIRVVSFIIKVEVLNIKIHHQGKIRCSS